MSLTFTQTDSAAVCGTIQASSAYGVGIGPQSTTATFSGTAGTVAKTVEVNRTAVGFKSCVMFETPAGQPNKSSWEAGNWTIRLNVTTGNSNLSINRAYICRISSGCGSSSLIGESPGLAIALNTTGVKTFFVPTTASSGLTTDRVYIVIVFRNVSTSNQTFAYTPNQIIESPIVPSDVSGGIVPVGEPSSTGNSLQFGVRNSFSLARLFRIVRKDGEQFRWTDHDRQVTLIEGGGPFVYQPKGAPSTQSRRSEDGANHENEEFDGYIFEDGFDDDEAFAGLWDHALVDTFVVDWRYPWAELLDFQRYWMHDLTWTGEIWNAQLRSLTGQVDIKVGRIMNRACDAVFGDDRCGIDVTLAAHSDTSLTVTSVTSLPGGDHPRQRFQCALTTRASKFFKHGYVVWATGDNAIDGINKFDVKKYDADAGGGIFTLWKNTPYNIQVGDTFAAVRGCGKVLHANCRKEFVNTPNHRGFNYMPSWKGVIKTPNKSS